MNDEETAIVHFEVPVEDYKKFKKKVVDEGTTMTAKGREWVRRYVEEP
jgi:hypothetical protein